ncbi:MAG TPA: hypothetical protein ENF36_04940 [Desulfobacteraceae bacterium]|nr:hypothetical protein [Desulfobacteraceae bacterium]
MNQKALIGQIVDPVLILDDDKASELIKKIFDEKVDLTTLINGGLRGGLQKLGEYFENREVFFV